MNTSFENELKPLERVLLAHQGKEVDRVPVCSLAVGCTRVLSGVSFEEFSRDAEKAANSIYVANRLINEDVIFSFIDLSVEAADFGQKMVYPLNSTAHPNYEDLLIKEVNDYKRLSTPNPRQSPRMSNYLEMTNKLVQYYRDFCPVVSFVYGPLGVLGMMRSYEKLYLDMLQYPDEVKVALETITHTLNEYVKAQCELGVTSVCIDTLPGSRSSIKPETWEEFEGKYVKQLADTIRESGCMVSNHGCGDSPYFREVKKWMEPELISFADLPDDCSDVNELKQTYGQDCTLMGYISTDMLFHASAAEILQESWKQIDTLGKGSKFILAPGCEYPPNKDIVNARALVLASESYNRANLNILRSLW